MNNLKIIRRNILRQKQKDLANELGISASTLCLYEKNERKLPLEIAFYISKKAGVTLEDIYVDI